MPVDYPGGYLAELARLNAASRLPSGLIERAITELRELRRAVRAVKHAALDYAAGGFGDPGRAMDRVREAVGVRDVDEDAAKAALDGRRRDIWDGVRDDVR